MDTLWPILGTIGIVLLDVSWGSQIFRIYRRKRADDVSVFFPLLNLIGRLLAMGYSMHRDEAVFTWGFLIGVFIRGIFLGQVLWYRWGSARRREQPVAALVGPISLRPRSSHAMAQVRR